MRLWLIGLPAALLAASPALAAEPGWTFSEATHGVTVNHAGTSHVAAKGEQLAIGDVVSTAANSRAVLVRGEQYAVVAPNSRLQLSDPVKSGGLMQFVQQFGNAVFSVKKMATPHFGVQTPYLAAVVKGTTFSVTVDQNKASVQVVEGAVQVSNLTGEVSQLVRPGVTAFVNATDNGKLFMQGAQTEMFEAPNSIAHVYRQVMFRINGPRFDLGGPDRFDNDHPILSMALQLIRTFALTLVCGFGVGFVVALTVSRARRPRSR